MEPRVCPEGGRRLAGRLGGSAAIALGKEGPSAQTLTRTAGTHRKGVEGRCLQSPSDPTHLRALAGSVLPARSLHLP